MSWTRRAWILAGARWLDAFDREDTWRIAGFHAFFCFLVGRILVGRVDGVGGGPGGLSPTGIDLVELLGADALGPVADRPGAVLAVLVGGLLAAPVSGWLLGHGPLARDLETRSLRVPVLHSCREAVALGHLLGAAATVATLALGSAAIVLLDAALRSPASALGSTLIAGLGAAVTTALVGSIFAALGSLVAVLLRRGRRALLVAAIALGGLWALAGIPVLGRLSPFGHAGGLLAGGAGSAGGHVALALLGAALGWGVVATFRRADL